MKTQEWITDSLPTVEDTDDVSEAHGLVLVPNDCPYGWGEEETQ